MHSRHCHAEAPQLGGASRRRVALHRALPGIRKLLEIGWRMAPRKLNLRE